MSQKDESAATDKLTFLLIGAGIGATLALLFAPKKGSELRGDIADYTKRGVDAAKQGARRLSERAGGLYETGRERAVDAYGHARERAVDVYGTTKERIGEAYGSAKERVSHGTESVAEMASRQKEQLSAAFEAGKQAYREEKRKTGDVARAAVEGDEV